MSTRKTKPAFPTGRFVKVDKVRVNRNGTIDVVVREKSLPPALRKNPAESKTHSFDLYWSPTGQKIATVTATTKRAAIRKAPPPYRKYKGEIYAEDRGPAVRNRRTRITRKRAATKRTQRKSKRKTTRDAKGKKKR